MASATAVAGDGYDHFLVGNPGDVVTPTSGLLVFQGGGTDVDENYIRMAKRGGGGDFVVIRASGGDASIRTSSSYVLAIRLKRL